MSTYSEKDLELPYIIVIPYKIQIDDTIPDAAKLYFGFLASLSQKFGYCWATDEQLAKAKKTSVKNIERWNMLLERAGHIHRDTYNEPIKEPGEKVRWIKKRKIYVDNAFCSKKEQESEVPKNGETDGVPKNEETDGVPKNGGCNNKPLDKNKDQPQVIVFPDLDLLDIDQSLKLKLSSEYSLDEISLAVKRTLNWTGRPSDKVGILSALKKSNDWNDDLSPQEKQEENLKFLKTLYALDGTILAGYNVVVGNKYIEFFHANGCSNCFSAENKDFIKHVTEYIELLKTK